ncbi:SemiSWEET transporter [Desertifilum sp. FACHB-1129]|uniref:MtN3 and saliva related transmembrane protein n=3 Tax=Cyanophyceae TaxID=3028117 RepID=A0A1E5QFE4_9CYAN|nr:MULTISPECIES: SemiSWEET transporter [Cyanophyceae]MCD8489044.1 SemiSWEET transporter [Desertifilum sp.]MDA0213055.1 SemiSWEET transporter [Cyanobacteria bacterium FC1]MDI9640749.1 SemiSWEET transporter [Geitlerinema splendidum]MDK3156537.1 SemiSWEET transporter [Kamptonema cortianum]MBD2314870.1 SemiSWEET transporter [Desertifilum sp. FACHB-1129]
MDAGITILGLTAGALTTLAFLPQMLKTYRSKSAKDVSSLMLITFCTGVFLWLVYGYFRKDVAVMLANSITLVLNLGIFYLKFRYK